MRLLVLGGTSFVGRHLVHAALAHGHAVTVFNRGRTNPGLFPQVEHRSGDRDTGDYASLTTGSWDAAVDVTAYVPRHVTEVLDSLGTRAGHYVQVSSVSAYDARCARQDEDSPLWPPPEPRTEQVNDETYGPLKAACERAATRRLGPGACAVVRPTYVVGPHDPTDRFTYWARRMSRGGRVAVTASDRPVQVIDARDLGAFLLTCATRRVVGTMDAVGPWARLRELLGALAVPDRAPQLVEVDPQVVAAAGLVLPLVCDDPATDALMTRPGTRAVAAGLHTRSLAETAADTVSWDAARGFPPLRVGPTPEQERALLAGSLGEPGAL